MHDILPPTARKIAYVVFAVIGVAFGATQTGFTTAEVAAPLWLTVAFQVYLYIGGAFGLVAAANTAKPTAQVKGADPDPETVTEVIASGEVTPVGDLDVSNLSTLEAPKHAALED